MSRKPIPAAAPETPGERRGVLGRLAVLLASPFLLGAGARSLAASALAEAPAPAQDRQPGGLRLAPPDRSVMRRG